MRRCMVLALLAACALGAGPANAATTLKTSGDWAFAYTWQDNINFFAMDGDNVSEDDFRASQRARINFDWTASESLRAVLGLEVGASVWGQNGLGADLDADDTVVEARHSYLDFAWPGAGVSFRMGVQPIALPGAVAGNPALEVDAAGILASYQFNDMASANLAWFRPQDATAGTDAMATNNGAAADGVNDEIDVLALLLPIKGDGFTLTPWAAYAAVGRNATLNANFPVGVAYAGLVNNATGAPSDNLDAWWFGAAFTLTRFDPLTVKADLIYGFTDGVNGSDKGGAGEREGWFFDIAANYKTDLVTPGMFFLYSTGEDDDNAGGERMPVMFTTAGYRPTSFGFGGGYSLLGDYCNLLGNTATGLMIVGGQLGKFSFADKLTHTLRAAWGQGTNDPDYVKKGWSAMDYQAHHGLPLTEKDDFWEVNFDSTYAIYENLTAYVNLGYIRLDLDNDTWKGRTSPLANADPEKIQDAWQLAVCLRYAF